MGYCKCKAPTTTDGIICGNCDGIKLSKIIDNRTKKSKKDDGVEE